MRGFGVKMAVTVTTHAIIRTPLDAGGIYCATVQGEGVMRNVGKHERKLKPTISDEA